MRKFIAIAPGYLNKVFKKGETVPKHLMPKRGASWINEVFTDGSQQSTLVTMKKGKKKKAKAKTKPVAEQDKDLGAAADEPPVQGYDETDGININDAYLALDPADDSHWNADGSVSIRNLNKMNGSNFTGADLSDEMDRHELVLLKSDG